MKYSAAVSSSRRKSRKVGLGRRRSDLLNVLSAWFDWRDASSAAE